VPGCGRSRLYAKDDHDPLDLRRTVLRLDLQRVCASERSSGAQHPLLGRAQHLGFAQLSRDSCDTAPSGSPSRVTSKAYRASARAKYLPALATARQPAQRGLIRENGCRSVRRGLANLDGTSSAAVGPSNVGPETTSFRHGYARPAVRPHRGRRSRAGCVPPRCAPRRGHNHRPLSWPAEIC
jgi:hypothetical protein